MIRTMLQEMETKNSGDILKTEGKVEWSVQ